jgi:hypothetical protein
LGAIFDTITSGYLWSRSSCKLFSLRNVDPFADTFKVAVLQGFDWAIGEKWESDGFYGTPNSGV